MASSTKTRRGDDERGRRSDPLAEAYLHWLVEQVKEEGHQAMTYWDLLRLLHETEFVWLIPNDDNRIMDGLELRNEFLRERGELNPHNYDRDRFGPCSVLEVMIGLSRRIEFTAGGIATGWAWQLLCNLELHKFRDPMTSRKEQRVVTILHNLVWRLYSPDGTGGFFPLAWPEEDQTKVELWYQMSAYIEEIHPEFR